jgi:hypothetical protein
MKASSLHPQFDSLWETLLPAVFGVPATEFEVDRRAYLVAHSGVPSLASGVNPNNSFLAEPVGLPLPRNCKEPLGDGSDLT